MKKWTAPGVQELNLSDTENRHGNGWNGGQSPSYSNDCDDDGPRGGGGRPGGNGGPVGPGPFGPGPGGHGPGKPGRR